MDAHCLPTGLTQQLTTFRSREATIVPRVRMCVIVTVDITLLNLCRGRFEYLQEHGFDVTAVCAQTEHAERIRSSGVRLFMVPLSRAVTPWRDILALWSLWRFLRRERFDLVEVSTPKGALIGAIAARLAGVPCVIHLLRGLAYEQKTGLKRWMLWLSQKLPCRLAHEVISISDSMREKAIQDRVCRREKIRVLGQGSSNGVDLNRFAPRDGEERMRLRQMYGIPQDAVVAGFVGRMTRDKGVVELIRAFDEVSARRPDLHLLLVGDYERRDRPPKEVIEVIAKHPRIHHVGWQADTVPYCAVMDFLILPTHREGFPTVLLEAAAMGLPTITTDIVGCRDAVVDGETGLVIAAQDVPALAGAIDRLSEDGSLRQRLGVNGRRRVESYFRQESVWALQEEAFRMLAASRARDPERRAALSILKSATELKQVVSPKISKDGEAKKSSLRSVTSSEGPFAPTR